MISILCLPHFADEELGCTRLFPSPLRTGLQLSPQLRRCLCGLSSCPAEFCRGDQGAEPSITTIPVVFVSDTLKPLFVRGNLKKRLLRPGRDPGLQEKCR